MKYDIPNAQRMSTANFLLQKINSKLVRIGLVGAQVNNVRRMNDNFTDFGCLHRSITFFNEHRVNRFTPRILRCSGIYHERAGAVRNSLLRRT
ncbi:hypothetical protein D3C78_1339590 [compost metagenome]